MEDNEKNEQLPAEQQEVAEAEDSAPPVTVSKKKIIAAFAAMGVVIVALMVALIVSNSGSDKKVKTGTSSAATQESSAADDSQKAASADSSETEDSEESEADDSEAEEESSAAEESTPEESQSDESSSGGSEVSADEVVVTWSGNNTWENSGVTMTGFECGVKNGTGSVISNWKLELEIDGIKNADGWNGTYTVGTNKLTITPADYNSEIQPGGNITLGANMGTSGKLNVKSAKLNGKEVKLVNGTVAQENNQQQQNNNGGGNNGSGDGSISAEEVKKLIAAPAAATKGDDWLHTDGSKILDKNGKQVWLTGLNWFGYNTGTNLFDGLWNSQLEPTVKAIADRGFNLIRVPMSAELLLQWKRGEYPKANYNNAYNPTLNALNSQEIFDYFLHLCCENGIKVMPDIHSAQTDASGHMTNLWCTDKIKVDDYYAALEYIADRYKNNDTIIAIDLKNEPHGKPSEGSSAAIWNDSKSANNWKYVAETAAAKVLAKNPNLLIMVEGTEIYSKKNGDYSSSNDDDYWFNWWGGNLRGVKDYPVDLGKYQDKLVYSPHDYGPTVYEQPWFKGSYNFDSLMKDCWRDNWFYIKEKNIAPLLIGEWGGFMTEPNLTWMTYMRKLIKDNNLNHTFWCLNANSGDTGGLLLDNFTDWDEEKYKFVKEVLWQESGKFVGLDHEVKLGKNGITLSNAKGL